MAQRLVWAAKQALGKAPWALSLPDKELCLREALAVFEVIDISPGNLDSSLCFLQPSVSHDVQLKGWFTSFIIILVLCTLC